MADALQQDDSCDNDAAIATALSDEHADFGDHLARLLAPLSPAAWSRPPPQPVGETASADKARLHSLLAQHGLEAAPIAGDGACQFRALADQLYRSETYHEAVRAAVVVQLRAFPALYEAFVSDWPSYDAFCTELVLPTTWGDHVTLQAAADAYGCRIAVVTSYAESSYAEVNPQVPLKTGRCLWLCLYAEVHYSSLYPQGEVPAIGVARVEQLEGQRR
jgi:OTU-like cysteine protease